MLAEQFLNSDPRWHTRVVMHGADADGWSAGESIDNRHLFVINRTDAGVQRWKH